MASSAWDRCRFQERLQAALAGLQELHILREHQEKMVYAALNLNEQPCATSSNQARIEGCREAGLQGHMSHLWNRLDQQLSALKVDDDKSSTENLENDSRPSSGFYELSDFSTYSLPNSCTSVYSECLSPQRKVKPCSPKCRNYFKNFECRPRSVDEKSLCVSPDINTKATPHLRRNSVLSNIQGKENQRPVSTGDLERFIQLYHGFQNKSAIQGPSAFDIKDDIFLQNVDPKYQKDLVSKNKNEIYTYPSPLHAVALQSPLFSLQSNESQNKCSTDKNSKYVSGLLPKPGLYEENKPKDDFNKMFQIKKCQEIELLKLSQRNAKNTEPALPCKMLISEHCPTGSIFQRQSQFSTMEENLEEQEHIKKQELQPNEFKEKEMSENPKITLPVPKTGRLVSLSTSLPNTVHNIQHNHMTNKTLQDSGQKKSCLSAKKHHPQNKIHESMDLKESEFVQAKFIPAESHHVKIGMSASKNIVNKKRRSSENRVAHSSAHIIEESRELRKIKDENIEHCKPKEGRQSIKRRCFFVPATRRSYSIDSLYPEHCRPYRARADTSPNILYSPSIMEVLPHMIVRHKWQSSVDIAVKQQLCNVSKSPHTVASHNRKPVKNAGRTHCSNLDIHGQSESEYSTECSSLFYSTVIETSDDGASEYTTNRFGDIGSIESESNNTTTTSGSSLTMNCKSLTVNELKWVDSISKTPVVPQSKKHLRPEPKVCRIKASKALKKKIRRFHPGSLKIITMI